MVHRRRCTSKIIWKFSFFICNRLVFVTHIGEPLDGNKTRIPTEDSILIGTMYDTSTLVQPDMGPALSSLAIFLWAAGGSLAMEIIALLNEIKAQRTAGLPGYYKNPWFWLLRLCVAAIAGALAIAEDATKPLIAITIGAAAPAILQLLANNPPQRR
jgi:hypothetical protein